MTFSNKYLFRIIFLMAVITLQRCQQKASPEGQLKGSWQAEWIMDPNPEDGAQTMNGKFEFFPGGKVHIEAYGFNGCLFACDTLSNDLLWTLDHDTLCITDKKDHSGLFYKIQYFSDDSIHMVLLDDIHIALQKI